MSDQRNDYRNDGHLRDCDDCAYVVTLAEAEGRRLGWDEALDTARERIMRLPYEIDDGFWIDRDEVLAWIDSLKTK